MIKRPREAILLCDNMYSTLWVSCHDKHIQLLYCTLRFLVQTYYTYNCKRVIICLSMRQTGQSNKVKGLNLTSMLVRTLCATTRGIRSKFACAAIEAWAGISRRTCWPDDRADRPTEPTTLGRGRANERPTERTSERAEDVRARSNVYGRSVKYWKKIRYHCLQFRVLARFIHNLSLHVSLRKIFYP